MYDQINYAFEGQKEGAIIKTVTLIRRNAVCQERSSFKSGLNGIFEQDSDCIQGTVVRID